MARVVADPQSLDRNIGVAVDGRIDRNGIILAGKLDAVAGEIDKRHRSSDVILILAGIAMGFGDEATPNVNYVTADKLPERLTFALDGKHLPARAVLVNLSAQLRKFHDALVRYHLQRDDLDRPTPKAKKKPRKR